MWALGWVASGGVSTVVITTVNRLWTGERLDAAELSRAIRDMRNGDWEPSEADGWTPADGPFDPDGYLGWNWTEVGNDVSDIAWGDLTAAGIDIDKVKRGDTRVGDDWYEYVGGDGPDDIRVVFGAGTDPGDGTTMGWDICTYERQHEDGGWAPVTQNWERTKELALGYVKKEVA